MKKKLSKIAALLLAAVMVITGLAVVPRNTVNAAGNPSFTVKTNTTQMKPGDTVHVQLWANAGTGVMQVVGGFDFDTSVYTYVSKSLSVNSELGLAAMNNGGQFIVNQEDVYTSGGFSVLLDLMGEPITGDVMLFEFDVTVNENASGSGLMTFNCEGCQTGTSDDDRQDVAPENVPTTTTDGNGNAISGGNIPVYIALDSIAIDHDDFTMAKGDTENLTVKGSPEVAMEGKTVKWSSDKTNIVKVDQNGKVEAVGIGTATITATVGDKSDSVKITVNAPLKGIKLNKTEVTLKKGTSETLTVIYDPDDTTDSKTVTWTSSDASVASVDNGKVTALKDGKATITATVGKHTATCTVTVQEVKLTGIKLDKNAVTVNKGESTDALKVIYDPENTTDDKTVTWSSSNEKVATVKDGVITGVGAGEAKITAKVGKFEATCDVKVISKLQSIQLTANKDTSKLEKGDKVNLTVGYTPADTTDSKDITWKSENEDVATVDEDGVVTAVDGGVTKIVATSAADSSIKAEIEIKVLIHTEEIKLDTEELELLKGHTSDPITVSFYPVETDDSKEVTWTSSDESVATVDAEGRVTGLKEGNATITATTVVGAHTDSFKVTVKEIHVEDATLSGELNPPEIYVGQQHAVKVTLDPENTTDDVYYIYESSDKEIATVSTDGVVSALKAGKAEIAVTVIAGEFVKKLTYEVEVKEIPLESIAFKQEVTPLEEGKTAQLEILFNPENTTVDKTVEWSSSNTDVATISETGLVTAVKKGTTTITAKAGGKEISYELTVTEKKATGTTTTPSGSNKDQNKDGKDNKTDNGGAVQTGDTSNIFGVMLAMLISFAVAAGVTVFRSRGKRMHK